MWGRFRDIFGRARQVAGRIREAASRVIRRGQPRPSGPARPQPQPQPTGSTRGSDPVGNAGVLDADPGAKPRGPFPTVDDALGYITDAGLTATDYWVCVPLPGSPGQPPNWFVYIAGS